VIATVLAIVLEAIGDLAFAAVRPPARLTPSGPFVRMAGVERE
jgi:hypothetical protein